MNTARAGSTPDKICYRECDGTKRSAVPVLALTAKTGTTPSDEATCRLSVPWERDCPRRAETQYGYIMTKIFKRTKAATSLF